MRIQVILQDELVRLADELALEKNTNRTIVIRMALHSFLAKQGKYGSKIPLMIGGKFILKNEWK